MTDDDFRLARHEYRKRLLFSGPSSVNRIYFRLMTSLRAAEDQGLIDMTLYLTERDFAWLCAYFDVDPRVARDLDMILVPEVGLKVLTSIMSSYFVGFDASGLSHSYPVIADAGFERSGFAD